MLTLLITLAVISVSYTLTIYLSRKRLPLPHPLPFIGNLHQLPKVNPWRESQKWHKQYGPGVSARFGPNTTIILGSTKAAHDLLDKRGAIYSSRPRRTVACEWVGRNIFTPLLPYSDKWKTHNRMHIHLLNACMSKRYRPLQDLESKHLVYEFLSTNDFEGQSHRFTFSIIFTLACGKRVLRGDEPEIQEADQLFEKKKWTVRYRALLVDVFPVMDYIVPRCLTKWKRIEDELFEAKSKLFAASFASAQEDRSWNWTKQIQQLKETQDMPLYEVSHIISMLFEGGHDTTSAALEVFMLASLLHPDAVQRAQQELDAVVGTARLLTFDDMESLKYVTAFVNEILRWCTIAPAGFFHAVVDDDEYMGNRIPKGAWVITNHWSMEFHENVFKDPYEFSPERWLENPDLPVNTFGFGRRVFVGQHLARYSLEIAISSVLWGYNISLAYDDASGKEMHVNLWDLMQDAILRPAPFKVTLQVRSAAHRNVIESELAAADKDASHILHGILADK